MRTKKKYFMPQWALTKIEALANFYETTKTQALLMMVSKGSNYYEKEMKKAGFPMEKEKPADNNAPDASNTEQQNDKGWNGLSEEETIKIAKAKAYDL